MIMGLSVKNVHDFYLFVESHSLLTVILLRKRNLSDDLSYNSIL